MLRFSLGNDEPIGQDEPAGDAAGNGPSDGAGAVDARGPRVAHPLVSEVGRNFVVAESNVGLLSLNSLRMGLVRQAADARLPVVWVTPPMSSMSVGMFKVMRESGGRWLVRDGDQLRVAGTRMAVASVGEALRRPGAPTLPPLAVPTGAAVPRTRISIEVRHSASSGLRLGGTLESLAAALGVTPDAWGTSEPELRSWSREAMTELVRSRMPGGALLFASGWGLSAVMRFRRGPRSVIEETSAVFEGTTPGSLLESGLKVVADRAVVVSAVASTDVGGPDLGFAATEPNPAPQLLIAEEKSLGLQAADIATLTKVGVLARIGLKGAGAVVVRMDPSHVAAAAQEASAAALQGTAAQQLRKAWGFTPGDEELETR